MATGPWAKLLLPATLPFLLGSDCMRTTPEEVSAEGRVSIPKREAEFKITVVNKRAPPPPRVPVCTTTSTAVSIHGEEKTVSETVVCR